MRPADAGAYGRLVTSSDGRLERIVEFKDANQAERAITLCNSGVMAVAGGRMFDLLAELTNDTAAGEYYLTDVVGIANGKGLSCGVVEAEEWELQGVNSRVELAKAEKVFQDKKREEMMVSGVTLIDPETVYFASDTKIERDVIVHPHVVFGAGVSIASGAEIHAFSHITGATIGANASVGPFARLRPGAVLEGNTRVGNFVEVKNATLKKGAKAGHLSYLGDAEIGENSNIGAGTITCNYDGFDKYKTIIGKDAFIGSDSTLVAPVTISDGAFVAAGSCITDDVESEALAIAREKQVQKAGWAREFRRLKQQKS
jgi:bifunctional UDP-N-acetylglucosamine pyrophosphorylase/glucosamine-1-phosphate N-acetyltransferase